MRWDPRVLTGGPIDEVFIALRRRFRELTVKRLEVCNPNDDDNVWFLTLSERNIELQMDARPGGGLPFVIESADSQVVAHEVDAAIAKLAEWLSG
jgi:hypothetical protein